MVARVIDGDTMDVTRDGQTLRVRLIRIDTPETIDPRKPVAQGRMSISAHFGVVDACRMVQLWGGQ